MMELELASTQASRADDSDKAVFRGGPASERTESLLSKDEAVLAQFGKKPRLKRRFKTLSTIGLTCSVILTWEVLLFNLQYGLGNGGPQGLIFGFLGASVGVMLQALTLAEMASMIPLAGGAFNWVAILAPPSSRRFLSYVTGWLTVFTWQMYNVLVCFACASVIQGIVILNNEQYTPKLWHGTLLAYAIVLVAFLINTVLGPMLPRVEASVLIFYILAFFGVLIPLVYLPERRPSSEVFGTFLNINGYASDGTAFLVGLLTAATSLLGVDCSDHIAEEIKEAAAVIPFTIWFSSLLNSLMGFGILVAIMYATPDYVKALRSPTNFPFMDIFKSAMGLKGAVALIVILTAINVLSTSSILATASRSLWAFSRENGLPGSRWLVKVDPKTRLPYNAIITTVVVDMLIILISVGSTAAFNAFGSLTTAAYYASFLVADGVIMYKRLTAPASELPWGPFRLGRLGFPINLIAFCYTVVVFIFSFFPGRVPVTPVSMNYACVVFGGAIVVMIISWIAHGRRRFVGPIWEFEGEYVRKNPLPFTPVDVIRNRGKGQRHTETVTNST